MSFLWPHLLWALTLLPACVVAYVLLLRRRKAALRYASLALVREAGASPRWRRHVPPALMALALGAALVAAARPTAPVVLPAHHRTVMLAVDVSLSMRASDVLPDRITAAQAAARAFVEERPPSTRIGLVAFGGAAQLVQAPTDRAADLLAAIDRIELQRATATGAGLAVALEALFPGEDLGLDEIASRGAPPGRRLPGHGAGERPPPGAPLAGKGRTDPARERPPPVAAGSSDAGVIVLLSDGRRTTGPDPLEVARVAAERGVRVYTVGFGTPEGTSLMLDGFTVYVRLDEETLRGVAAMTHGEYFQASTASELQKVYRTLNAKLVMERRDTELTALFSAAAACLAALSGALSLAWFGRMG
ncbi:MAG TPA: VWA domain-containing protein [Burkholderiaceae bacterium]|nr:VWA domain-containing protein [Burkholderiaceae bacterium]